MRLQPDRRSPGAVGLPSDHRSRICERSSARAPRVCFVLPCLLASVVIMSLPTTEAAARLAARFAHHLAHVCSCYSSFVCRWSWLAALRGAPCEDQRWLEPPASAHPDGQERLCAETGSRASESWPPGLFRGHGRERPHRVAAVHPRRRWLRRVARQQPRVRVPLCCFWPEF